jgi:hypothetical protein
MDPGVEARESEVLVHNTPAKKASDDEDKILQVPKRDWLARACQAGIGWLARIRAGAGHALRLAIVRRPMLAIHSKRFAADRRTQDADHLNASTMAILADV